MTITMRPFASEGDLYLIDDLVHAVSPLARHSVDLPWRLSTSALRAGHDARLWEDEHGTLLGFAAWQRWWAALDFFIRPGPLAQEVETQLFAWAAERFRELDRERGWPLPYWVDFRDDDVERRAMAERHGFVLDDDYHYVCMSRSLAEPIALSALPAGFILRPLAGPQEVDAYVALHCAAFESTSMTADWRKNTLQHPWYQAQLDLVAVAPDGSLAGFCVGWLDRLRKVGQVEPIGVHPQFHRLGLGNALLLESLRRFKMHGADNVLVETDSGRSAAIYAYEAVGFRLAHQGLRKGQWFSKTHPPDVLGA